MGYQIKSKDKVSHIFWKYLPEGILSFIIGFLIGLILF